MTCIDIVNCLHMKDLALVNPEEGVTLRSFLSFYGRQIPKIRGGILILREKRRKRSQRRERQIEHFNF